MDIRTLRRKRIIILLICVVGLAAATGGVYTIQKYRKNNRFTLLREQGMTAYQAKDFKVTVENLQPYVDQHLEDIEAWYAYGLARLSLPTKGYAHIRVAMDAFRHVYLMDSQYEQVAQDLLRLYARTGLDDQAVTLADEMLARDPQNRAVRRTKVLSMGRLGQTSQAWELTQKLIEQQPDDFSMQLAGLQFRFKLGHTLDDVLADVRPMYEQHRDDPRYELILGTALGMGGQRAQAVEHLRHAAAKPMPKDIPLATVVRLLNQAQLFPEATDLLIREVELDDDAPLAHEKVRRLFETGRLSQITSALQDRELTAPNAQMIAILALAAYQQGDFDQAQARVDSLLSLPQARARGWHMALEAMLVHQLKPTQATVAPLRAAVALVPDSAYLVSLLGESYAAAREWSLAIEQWRQAVKLRPVWARPHHQLARTLLRIGQLDAALKHAQAALVRQPNRVDLAMLVAQVRAAQLDVTDPRAKQNLMALLDEIDRQSGSVIATFTLRVETFARWGDLETAKQWIGRVASQQVQLPDSTVLRLVEISRTYELGLEASLLSRIQGDATPQAKVVQALRQIQAGQVDEAIAMIDQARSAGGVAWKMAWARVLDAAGDERAAAQWQQLTEQYPFNVQLQILALRSNVLAHDRTQAQAIVKHLRTLMGEETTRWRIEQARWLLRQTDSTTAIGDATKRLREVLDQGATDIEVHGLLARAYEQAGRVSLAIRQMQIALTQHPHELGLKLELARLHQLMGSNDVASEQLNQVAFHPTATPRQLRQAAKLLAQQGADLRSITVLEELQSRESEFLSADELLLATLYRRIGRTADAQAMCERLLTHPTVGRVLFVAEFYAQQNRQPRVDQTLELLDTIELTEAQRHTARAMFAARFGSAEQATAHYRSAVEADPDDAQRWRRLVAFELTSQQVNAALTDAQQAIDQLGPLRDMQTLLDHQTLFRRFLANDLWRGVAVAILTEPAQQSVGVEVLTRLEPVSQDDLKQQAQLVRELADQHLAFLTLQLALTRTYQQAGELQQAAEIAQRTVERFATSIEAARVTAEVMAQAHRWPEALRAASQWRDRSAGRVIGADMIIAEARLHMGQVQAAIRQLQPYLAEALGDPVTHPQIIIHHVRNLIADQRHPEARTVLRLLLGEDVVWRAMWNQIAAVALKDVEVAAAWLGELESFVPDQAFEEQTPLAQAWWSLFLRSGTLAYRDAAKKWIEQATSMPRASAEAWMIKGIIAESLEQKSQAQQAYRTALSHNPGLASAMNNLAMLLDEPQQWDEATKLAQAAVDIEPTSAEYLDTLSQVHMRAGRHEPAIAAMQIAVAIDPGNPNWQWSLLDLYEAGDLEEKAQHLRSELELQYPLGR